MTRDSNSSRPRGVNTRAVHGGERRERGAVSVPIVHSSTFLSPSIDAMMEEQERGAAGAFYQRYGHPTLRAVEQELAALEGAEAGLLFASGMAAISTMLLGMLRPGDHVIAIAQCYGGTLEALKWGSERFGWSHTLVDARRPDAWQAAFKPNTRLVHVESPTNPTLCIVDLARAAELAHAGGAWFTVDNTFASPVGQQPLALGADLSVHSATKSIGGHGDLLAGVVLGSRARIDAVWKARKLFGGLLDPTTAWIIERSLKTLPLRVAACNANALALARRLDGHADVRCVFYPGLASHPGHEVAARQMILGFGPVLAIELRDLEQATAVLEGLEIFGLGPSLGGVESLASIPALTSHRQLSDADRAAAGIPAGVLRLSVGIEDLEDLWADLDHALTRSRVTTG